MLKTIFQMLWKTATAYVVIGFAAIQLGSIVVENISTQKVLGVPSEVFMQTLLVGIPVLLPIVLLVTYFIKRGSLAEETENQRKSINKAKKTGDYKKKIAVVPFENLNKEGEGDFLVDGIVEDLITEFSMIKEIDVASRKTCFEYREKNESIESFINDWDLDFVVSGSIRAVEDRIRVSVELLEVEDSRVIWSNKYDRVKTDIFEVQDEIVTKIINSMIGEIELSSLKRAHRKPTKNMSSYELVLKGRDLNQQFEKSANAEAIEILDAAIEADETNSLAYSWKACTMGQALALGFQERTDEFLGGLLESVGKATEIDANNWNANRIMGEVHLTLNDFEQTKNFANKAFNANPNNPAVLSIYGESLLRTGDIEKGIKILEKGLELDPMPINDTNSDRWLNALFFANYLNKDFNKCREIFKEIENFDAKTWLSFIDLKNLSEESYKDEAWFEQGLNLFKDLDWEITIEGFHLHEESLKTNLSQLALNSTS